MSRISLLSLLLLTASFPVLAATADTSSVTPTDLLKARLEAARNQAAGKDAPDLKTDIKNSASAPIAKPVEKAIAEKPIAPKPVIAKTEQAKIIPAPVAELKAPATPVTKPTAISKAPSPLDTLMDGKQNAASKTAVPIVTPPPVIHPSPAPAIVAAKDTAPAPKIIPAPVANPTVVPAIVQAEAKVSPPKVPQAAPGMIASRTPETAPALPSPKALPPVDDKLALSQALPPAKPQIVSLENSKVVPAPVQKAGTIAPLAQTARILPPATRKNAPFQPAPAAAKGNWSVRTVNAGNDTFCLMENRFDNDVTFMVGQRADGYSTLGLNYGIEMLQPDRNYMVTVQVDDVFEENFVAYAESDQTLVVQLGKKRSFFDALTTANAIRVAMQGSASTFTATGIAQNLSKMSQCLTQIGGTSLAEVNPNAMPAVPVAPVIAMDTMAPPAKIEPVKIKQQPIAQSVAVPSPVAPKPTAAKAIPAPVIAPAIVQAPTPAPVPAQRVVPAPVMAAPKAAPVIAAAPVVMAPPIVTPPAVMPAPVAKIAEAKPAPAQVAKPDLMANVSAILRKAGLKTQNLHQAGDQIQWRDSSGKVSARAAQVADKDILDAADHVVANAEKSCAGEFSVQMGVPEESGKTTVQPMESKCVTKNGIAVSAWVVVQQNDQTTAWEMQTPVASRKLAFDARDSLMNSLKK